MCNLKELLVIWGQNKLSLGSVGKINIGLMSELSSELESGYG